MLFQSRVFCLSSLFGGGLNINNQFYDNSSARINFREIIWLNGFCRFYGR